MKTAFYKKPFRLKRIFESRDLEASDAGASIAQNIELIIFTPFGKHRYDPGFGCEIWELDFELIVSETTWEEKFRQSLLRSVFRYEPRLYDVQVEIKMTEVEKFHLVKQITEIKKKVEILVRGKVTTTGENYVFSTALFLSPLSV